MHGTTKHVSMYHKETYSQFLYFLIVAHALRNLMPLRAMSYELLPMTGNQCQAFV